MIKLQINDWRKKRKYDIINKIDILNLIADAEPGAIVKVFENNKIIFKYDNALIYDSGKDTEEYNALYYWAKSKTNPYE
jgi:hypothetical protein